MPSFFKKLVQTGAKIGEAAAPIVGGALGGPAGAMAGKAVAGGIKKIASAKALGGQSFTPSSAGSIGEARTQDRKRMQDQYGLGSNGG